MCQQENIPYYVRMRVKNCAGLSVELHSPPILIDKTVPSSGVVKDGPDFQSDILWLRDNTKVTGMASSTAVPERKKNASFIHFVVCYGFFYCCSLRKKKKML